MAGTKIINIQKNDSFVEVIDIFQDCQADEVIFIFPRGSKFSQDNSYLREIKDKAGILDKKVAIMTADPVIAEFAKNFGLELLSRTKSGEIKTGKETLAAEEKDLPAADLAGFENEYPEAALTAARYRLPLRSEETEQSGKLIRDIIKDEPERSQEVEIEEDDEDSLFDLEVRSEVDKGGISIEKIWSPRVREEPIIFKQGRKKSRGNLKKTVMAAASGIALVVLIVIYSSLAKAEITIHPKKQNLDFQLRISASSGTASIVKEFNRIPGQLFSARVEEEGVFPATGFKNVTQKASGKITIYSRSFTLQRLVATTRFESPDGLIFRIPATITIPPAEKKDGNIVEAKVESVVFADKPGPEYNINPARFSIPGLKGSPKFDEFYGVSAQPMAGGLIGDSKVITEGDVAKASDEISQKIKEKIIKSLKGQVGNFKFLEPAEIKFEKPEFSANVSQAADEFRINLQGYGQVIAFREDDILKLVDDYLTKNGNLELVKEKYHLEYLNPVTNLVSKTTTFSLKISGQGAAKIDEAKIMEEIPGLEESAIYSYFKNFEAIESARVILSPFWINKIPLAQGKIKLRVIID